ncbi:MAG: DUF4159 domain-containing protein [Proteobacteria bacterium]|nr:DUF4159 domain-containing protein [Pseudomonadota bacterium]
MGFVVPSLLLALVILPAVWWFIRHLPPAPRKVDFPALALLRPLDETLPPPRTPPLWLLILRLLMVSTLIVLLAEPFLSEGDEPVYQKAPFVVVVENDWRAAPYWSDIRQLTQTALQEAKRQQAKVLLVPTAEADKLLLTSADEALQRLEHLMPAPWPAKTVEAVQTATTVMQAAGESTANVVWLSSGMADNAKERGETLRLLGAFGQAYVYVPAADDLPTMIDGVKPTEDGMLVRLWHPARKPFSAVSLYDNDGRFVTRGLPDASAVTDKNTLDVALKVPSTVTGAGVLRLDGEEHLGAWRGLAQIRGIPRVGLMTTPNQDFPLLSGTYYLENALSPLGKPRQMTEETALDGFNLILLDHQPEHIPDLQKWVQQGGVLVTFAGTWLENNRDMDPLLPVRLRPRPRELAGPLSWGGALKVGKARPDTPLQNLTVPKDVHVTTQFLPENAPDIANYTWLALEDDTPLVTGRKEGNGYMILIHVAADVRWSSLPLSGFYLDILSDIVNLARGEADSKPVYPLPPYKLVDAFGNPRPVPDTLTVLTEGAVVSRDAPVGFYGPAGAPVPHNLNRPQMRGVPVTRDDLKGLSVRTYSEGAARIPFQPYLATLLAVLVVLDTLARVWGTLARRFGFAVLALLVAAQPTHAQEGFGQMPSQDAAYATQIGWISSGNATVDQITESGLKTLSALLRFRTTVEAAPPKKLDLDADDLGYYPLIYWSVIPNPPPMSVEAAEKLRHYMQNGGLLVLDNQTELGYAGAATEMIMNRIVKRPLMELRDTHVLGRSYYLMRGQFPGRVTGQPVWIENTSATAAVIVGSNDWVGAWAADENSKPMRPVIPGGETQRTMALRFGINLVMYALLGDYKADQLHIDALLNRIKEEAQ